MERYKSPEGLEHVRVEPVGSVTWGRPARGGDGVVRAGVRVRERTNVEDGPGRVRDYHVSVPATSDAAAHIADEACPYINLDAHECQQFANLVEEAAVAHVHGGSSSLERGAHGDD